MLGSESTYFYKSRLQLNVARCSLINYLKLWDYSFEKIEVYLKAFDYFTCRPNEFDGATLSKDLCDLPGLDLSALLHDWMYIYLNVASNVRTKWMADLIFSKEMEKRGKGLYSAYSRFAGLTLSGIGFIPFSRIKRGKITKEQKEEVQRIYNILMK